ncbi:uncharacterized protein LOC130993058 [Salvia miltiorrhiza]|uniref:uncharacterized protein LOC130993058 n=1 Tax=Salvia miltiorrhiza TaxID=226208 RepID=UPI0025ABF82F|nr:uncharacterized protein LOC130993058 [Salvia miltiorrhiza]
MFAQIRKFKFCDVRFSHVACSQSLANYILLQLHQFSSPATNALESSSKDPNPKSFAAVYLENNYGVPPKRVLSYSKHLNFDSPEKPLYAIAFLKKHHFTDSDISRIVKKWPVVLTCGLESNFLPKFEFLRSLGLSSSEFVKILTLQPRLINRSLEGQIIPCVDFLRGFLGSDKDVVFSILRYPGILGESLQKTLLPNVGILRDAGVPESHIAALLRAASRGLALDPGNFKLTVQEVINLGFNPATKAFIRGLKVMRQLNSLSWREKVKHYTRWGWSEDQVLYAIRKYPLMMAVSKEKITKISDLIINTMACDASIFMTRPVIFTLSFEGRIAPRCAFYQVLLSKGLVRESSLASIIVCKPSLFVEKYVKRFGEEDPELLKLYEDLFGKSKSLDFLCAS